MLHNPRKAQPIWVQFFDLFLIELTNWRWSWRTMLLTSTIAPMFSIVGLSIFAHNASQETLTYILTGNVVMSLAFGIMDKIQNHYMYMRIMGALDYFATLPIQRYTLILAMVLAFFLLTLPSVILTILFGIFFLHLSIHPSPLLLLVMPLCAVPLAGIGAFIAAYSRTPENSGAISVLLTFFLVGLGPVVVPPDRLPHIMILLGYLSPATYAASALRQTLLGPLTARILLDITVMCGFSIVTFWLVGRKLRMTAI